MEKTKNIEIKKGVKLHIIQTDKFKTNLVSVFLSTPLSKENVTKNALIPAVLRRGTRNMPSQKEISIALEEMYGATFDCGVDKIGDDQVLKFYLETINNEFLMNNENTLGTAIKVILDVVFNPLIKDKQFDNDYVNSEIKNLRQVIEGRKDSKAKYAYERCIEEMYKNMPYGLHKYGNVSDLEEINSKNLYEQYINLIDNCKIDIFISGNVDEKIIEDVIYNENIQNLCIRKPIYIVNNKENRKKEPKKEQQVFEAMEVNQGKLIIGLDILEENDFDKYIAFVYNVILGGSPTSKLFQNVREKNSLAYTASSSFIRQKANVFIKCGIDIDNYEKALKIIKEQLEDMKKGEFTEKNIEEAKTNIISTINIIQEEQDTELMYHFSQELSGYEMDYEEFIQKINCVSKDNIIDLANKIQVNTVYFLKN